MAKCAIKWFQVAVLISSLVAGTVSFAAEDVDDKTERPGFLVVTADTILIRPVTLVATLIGSVLFVVTLPVTAITGTVGEAGKTLVVDPALTTFARCLGCTEVGWRKLPKKDSL